MSPFDVLSYRLSFADRMSIEDAQAIAQLRAVAARLPEVHAEAVRLVADQFEANTRYRVAQLRAVAVP